MHFCRLVSFLVQAGRARCASGPGLAQNPRTRWIAGAGDWQVAAVPSGP